MGRRAAVLWGLLAAAAVVATACSGPPPVQGTTGATASVPEPTSIPVPVDRDEVVAAFVDAWNASDWDHIDRLVFDPEVGPGARHREAWAELGVVAAQIETGTLEEDGLRARMPLEVSLELDRLGTWEYETVLGVVEVGDRWFVEWSPQVIHPGLVDGRRLERRRVWPERGTIRAWDGAPLRTDRPIVRVGIEPRSITDRPALVAELEDLLEIPAGVIDEALDAPGVQPDWFVAVAAVRAEDYPDVGPFVEALDGVLVRREFDRRAPTDDYAVQVLGTVGDITVEQLDAWGEPYDATRIVGRSGLELVHEFDLAGTPGGDIRLVDSAGGLVSVLEVFVGEEAVDVVTTLDADVQAAAEEAMNTIENPAALVAVDIATGQVRAVVSRPVEEFGRALSGAYPPGSTFKTITAAAFIENGGSSGTSVSCPPEVFVGGLRFTNAGGGSLGSVSLASAYAASCNTAFVNAATTFDHEVLAAAAGRFGFGLDYSIGLDTASATLPEPIDDAEFAASAIGQARVTASPLHMATVAAAVAGGQWQEPVLILEPQRNRGFEPSRLDPDMVTQLQSMMRLVVTNGTGGAVSSAGSDISGKTGSAEFGNDDPPETHAWFIGYRDDLAFAVLVEAGGAGGSVAAPVAAEFLALLDATREAAGN
jgi:cell division protein FtsI/penicillin-binding protein 2